jgi:hypothetical protein
MEIMLASDNVPHLIEQFWFARDRHSHYSVRHADDFAFQNFKLKPN